MPDRSGTDKHRKAYYEAIEAADAKYASTGFDSKVVLEMEALIGALLAEQLAHLHKNATHND